LFGLHAIDRRLQGLQRMADIQLFPILHLAQSLGCSRPRSPWIMDRGDLRGAEPEPGTIPPHQLIGNYGGRAFGAISHLRVPQ
jgi:hypothetical protein